MFGFKLRLGKLGGSIHVTLVLQNSILFGLELGKPGFVFLSDPQGSQAIFFFTLFA